MLVGVDGRPLVVRGGGPTRNEFTESRVNAELQALDSLLHIKWMPNAVGVLGKPGEREGRYALCSRWPSIDPRQEWVRKGEYDPDSAFDILGWFCEDLQDAESVPAEPESILHKVLELLHRCDNTKFPWRKRMAEVIEHNKKRQAKMKEEAVDEVKDMAADQYFHSNRASRVFMTNPGGR